MDENSLNGAQNVGQNRSANPAADGKIDDANGNAQPNVPQYTIPGILHFIEHEWQRFQAERSQWDTDRAELQVSRAMWVINRLEFAVASRQGKHQKNSLVLKLFSALLREKTLRFSLTRPFLSLAIR